MHAKNQLKDWNCSEIIKSRSFVKCESFLLAQTNWSDDIKVDCLNSFLRLFLCKICDNENQSLFFHYSVLLSIFWNESKIHVVKACGRNWKILKSPARFVSSVELWLYKVRHSIKNSLISWYVSCHFLTFNIRAKSWKFSRVGVTCQQRKHKFSLINYFWVTFWRKFHACQRYLNNNDSGWRNWC